MVPTKMVWKHCTKSWNENFKNKYTRNMLQKLDATCIQNNVPYATSKTSLTTHIREVQKRDGETINKQIIISVLKCKRT